MSMKPVLILLFLLAFGCAAATFIENDFGSNAARALVYNNLWFEIALFILALALVVNMARFSSWQKMPIFVFHCSIVVILFGAFITRNFGYEGTMHIREGSSTNIILSSDSYLKVSSSGLNDSFRLLLSPLTAPEKSFNANLGGGAPITLKTKAFYQNATEGVVPDPNGTAFISLLVTGGAEGVEVELFEDEYVDMGAFALGFGANMSFEKPSIIITRDGEQLTIRAYSDLMRLDMDTKDQTNLRAHTFHPLDTRKLYTTLDGIKLVVRDHLNSASRKVVPTQEKTGLSAIVLDATFKNETKEIALLGGSGMVGKDETVEFGDRAFTLAFGSEAIELPFALKLNKFLIERYPGSRSPSSYESQVTLTDSLGSLNEEHRIYMNNILKHRGFRFYQSSYDRDEKGTILSVSNDPGVYLTYLGYILLSVGFFVAFFSPKSRFRTLAGKIEKNRRLRTHALSLVAAAILVISPISSYADETTPSADETTQTETAQTEHIYGIVDAQHAANFGLLLVQDNGGRIKPMDTLALEALNKMTGKSSLKTLSATQVFLGMMSAPQGWQQVKMIRLTHPEIAPLIGLEEGTKEASFGDFFIYHEGENGGFEYKLATQVNDATRIKESDRSKLQKELIKIDERVNVAYLIYQGYLLRIIPIKNDPSFTWVAPTDMLEKLSPNDVKEAAQTLYDYIEALKGAQLNGSWQRAEEALSALKAYQLEYGAAVIPSNARISAERLLNHLNLFEILTALYFIIGFSLLLFAFVQVLKPSASRVRDHISTGFTVLLSVLFALHTFALGLRWYVSGHAPWSNGYESMIYIAWATLLAGLIFSKRSVFALSAAAILSGFALMVAHLSLMDPQITTLVPVLKSHWLTIHVSVISASYGFLGLSMLLGLIALALFALRSAKIRSLDGAISELTRINEMSMMVGLALLSIGNIFGAVWANESWGRYWSWDPKETWTLISMLVYAAILHFRFVPELKSAYVFSLSSVLGFFSIIMTYFGVNYYLSGMHSYASGEPVPMPAWLPISVVILLVLAALAWLKSDSKYPLER